MECACDFEVDTSDGEYCEFYHAKRLKSFKNHKCDECGKQIVGGQTYEIVRGKFEGDWFTHKTCPVCLELRDKLFSSGYYHGLILEQISENLWEIGGIAESCIADLSPPARDVLCDIIEDAMGWDDLDSIDDKN